MKKYKGVLATKHVSKNNICISEDALNNIANDNYSNFIPVTFNFTGNPIGHVNKLEMVDGELICSFTITAPLSEKLINGMIESGAFIVPGGVVNPEDIEVDSNGIKTIKKMAIREASITLIPADSKLRKIEGLD